MNVSDECVSNHKIEWYREGLMISLPSLNREGRLFCVLKQRQAFLRTKDCAFQRYDFQNEQKRFAMKECFYVIISSYLVIINLTALCMMYADKKRAKNNAWRIPEHTLFLVAALGGSLGSLSGMRLFHHKTRHRKFVVGMPVLFILQFALAVYVFTRLINL